MLKLLTSLMLHKQISFEEGKIALFKIPVLITPADYIVDLQKHLEKIGLQNLLYHSAKKSGYNWFKSMDGNYGLKIKDIMKWGPDLVSLAGWGKVTVRKKRDSEKSLLVTLEESVNAKLYGKSDKSTDNFFRGLVCGAWSYAYNTDLEAIELKCYSKGDKYCEILITPKDKIDYSDAIVKQQLDLPKEYSFLLNK